MQIEIQANGFELTGALNDYIHSRLEFALSRFRGLIRKTTVSLSDQNGPRGGVDKECVVRIQTDDLHELVIRDIESDAYKAISRAIARAKHSLSREVSKLNLKNRRREKLSIDDADSTPETL